VVAAGPAGGSCAGDRTPHVAVALLDEEPGGVVVREHETSVRL
jgi:hypothetical protein